MGAVATFNLTAFLARYPEFTPAASYTGVNSTNGPLFFGEATVYWRNDGSGPVIDPITQQTFLNQLTAHVAMLAIGTVQSPASGLVGRISSAGQGSVNVSADYSGTPGTLAWFNQTSYGAAFAQASAAYRTMRYRPRRGRFMGPVGGYPGGGGSFW